MFAHSTSDATCADWERLADHLRDVSERAGDFAAPFGWQALARAAGLLHDIGKTSNAYQTYIGAPPQSGRRGPDHSTAGAREAERLYGRSFGRLIAFAVAGHHAGLADFDSLKRRVQQERLEDYTGWQAHAGELSAAASLGPTGPFRPNAHQGFSQAFLTRMLFSCLVDADFLATERFYTGQQRPPPRDLASLQERLTAHLRGKRHDDTELNRLRAQVLDHALGKAGLEPGLFTLTVPTGGVRQYDRPTWLSRSSRGRPLTGARIETTRSRPACPRSTSPPHGGADRNRTNSVLSARLLSRPLSAWENKRREIIS